MKEFKGLTRRGLLAGFIAAAAVGRAAAASRSMPPQHWIDPLQEMADALAAGQITPLQWCTEIETLSAQVDLAGLLAIANQAAGGGARADDGNGPQRRPVRFRLGQQSYGAALLDFSAENVISPRAHRNMVSAHLVLEGSVRIRTFERVRDDKKGIVIKPAEDKVAGAGGISTLCDERRNVHWFAPQGGPATLLEIAIEQGAPGEITAIDPLGGKKLKDGSILAPIIGLDAAAAKYTADL